jgi:hypothetical protein
MMTGKRDSVKDPGSGNISIRDLEWTLIRGSGDISPRGQMLVGGYPALMRGDAIARKQMKAVVMQLQLELRNYLHNSDRENKYAKCNI